LFKYKKKLEVEYLPRMILLWRVHAWLYCWIRL